MAESGAKFTYTLYDMIDEDGCKFAHCGPLPDYATYDTLLPYCFIRTSSVMYEVAAVGKKAQFPPLRRRQDFGFFLSLLKIVDRAYLLNDTLCSYRVRKDSLSSSKFRNISYQWNLYRRIEGLGVAKASRVLSGWFFRAGCAHAARMSRKYWGRVLSGSRR
jgi:hypothetical protein